MKRSRSVTSPMSLIALRRYPSRRAAALRLWLPPAVPRARLNRCRWRVRTALGIRMSRTHGLIEPLEAPVLAAISSYVNPSARSRRHSRRRASRAAPRRVSGGRGMPASQVARRSSLTSPTTARISAKVLPCRRSRRARAIRRWCSVMEMTVRTRYDENEESVHRPPCQTYGCVGYACVGKWGPDQLGYRTEQTA